MATPKGEVQFEAMGTTYRLRYGINALCVLEDKLGMGVADIGKAMGDGLRLTTLRTVFAAGLSGFNGGEEAVGDLMDEIGVEKAGQLVGEAFTAAFPTAKKGAGGKVDPRPAAAGTGSTS